MTTIFAPTSTGLVATILVLAAISIVVSKTHGVNTAANVGNERQKPQRSFNPERQKPMSVDSEDLNVSLDRVEPCGDCVGNASFTLAIKNKVQGSVKTANIRNETAQLGSRLDQAKVKTKSLDTMKLVRKNCGESNGAPENFINATAITLSSGPKKIAHLTFQPMGQCLQNTELDVPIE